MDEDMTFDDQLLLNAMTMSLYARFDDYKTTTDIARWIVNQIQIHPHYDTVLDAVFRTDAWLNVDYQIRKHFETEKFAITVDVSADNGERRQFKIDPKNMNVTQTLCFTLPVNQITYSINGFGLCLIRIVQKFAEKQPPEQKSVPFQLTQEFKPKPWFSEIHAKTCMIYTPTPEDRKFVTDNYNRTMVIEVELPSGTRINPRQIGFFLSRFKEVMDFTYEPHINKLLFFINVPSTNFGKPICLEWCLERLSWVVEWSPVKVRVYDYLRQEIQLIKLVPIDFQPELLGYEFIKVVHQKRPPLEILGNLQKPKQV